MIWYGDCREVLRTFVLMGLQANMCVTSPPYFGLRDYDVPPTRWPEVEFVPMHGMPSIQIPAIECCLGLESDPMAFVGHVVAVFREVRRVLRDDGTLWLNLGDSYSTESKWGGSTGGKAAAGLHGSGGGGRVKARHGVPDKNLLGIPWRVAFALCADGWYLRQEIIWAKPNPMPESVKDRYTKSHEQIFLLSKSPKYYFDLEAIREESVKGAAGSSFNKGKTATHQLGRPSDAERAEDGLRSKRDVWTVATRPYKGAHFATFPPSLIEPCILAGSPLGGVVLDPFMGSGTTAAVAKQHGRQYLGCELNSEYRTLIEERLAPIDAPASKR